MELILSKDVREFWEAINKGMTDFEKAVLIFEFKDCWEECCEALNTLQLSTTDEILKHQINERIEYENQVVENVKKEMKDVVFVVSHYDDEDEETSTDGIFKTFSSAKKYGDTLNCGYNIEKVRVNDDESMLDEDSVYQRLGNITFNDDGKIYCAYDREDQEDRPFEHGEHRFEGAYISIPHPFKRGDILRNVRTGEIGVLYSDKNGWEAEERRIRERGLAHDFTDTYLNMEVFNENCEFNHSHPCPLELEFANLGESDERYEVIREARDLMMGNGSIDCFQYCIQEYLSERGEKRVILKR